MGGVSIYAIFTGRLSKEQVEDRFDELYNDACEEYRDEEYSGSWDTTDGTIKFHDQTFNNVKDAEDFINEHADKWECAWATKCWITNSELIWFTNHQVKPVDNDHQLVWIIGCTAAM